MDEAAKQAPAIVAACGRAWGYLRDKNLTAQARRGHAQSCLSAYKHNSGILSSYVRDFCSQAKLAAAESALHALQNLAEGFAKQDQ